MEIAGRREQDQDGEPHCGTQGTPDAGDPETQDETFIAPVDGMIEGQGFAWSTTRPALHGLGSSTQSKWHRCPVELEVISILQNIVPKENKDFPDELDDDVEEAVRRARSKRVKNGGSSVPSSAQGPTRSTADSQASVAATRHRPDWWLMHSLAVSLA